LKQQQWFRLFVLKTEVAALCPVSQRRCIPGYVCVKTSQLAIYNEYDGGRQMELRQHIPRFWVGWRAVKPTAYTLLQTHKLHETRYRSQKCSTGNIIRPHRPYYVRRCGLLLPAERGLSICHTSEFCKNGWTNRDAVYGL